ncbi:MAG: DNA repair protein RecO [Nitriliruptorales bacterium]|nr:DNA repair protein RecO [Nitriliruptorales bacterium]
MGSYREQGIVLRTWKLGETDRILNLLTQGRGKVRAVAKGVRRPGSRFGGRLEPYSHVDLQLHEGRNLDVVRQAELIRSYAEVREDYSLSTCGALMVEAVDVVAQEGERDNRVFLLLRAGLEALAARPPYPAIFADAFLLRLASAVGFHVFTDACSSCRSAGPHPFLSVVAGGMLCADCAPPGTKALDPDTIALVQLLAGNEWQRLPSAATQVGPRSTAASFTRAFVEYHLDRRLRSYELVPR